MNNRILVSPMVALLTVVFCTAGFLWLEKQKHVADFAPFLGTAQISIFPLALCSAFAIVNLLRKR